VVNGELVASAPTGNNSALQRSLVSGLRHALLFANLLEVIVDEGPGALGDGGSHLLQAGSHGQVQARVESRPEADGEVEEVTRYQDL
jgi:hypothetical protein